MRSKSMLALCLRLLLTGRQEKQKQTSDDPIVAS